MLFDTKDQTEEAIDTIWCDDYEFVSAQHDAPCADTVQGFGKEHGVVFSEEYLAHACGFFSGIHFEVKEEVWPRPGGGPFWSFLHGLYTYAYNDEAPDWMSIRDATARFAESGHTVVPVLKVIGNADVYCFNADGAIVQWDRDTDEFTPFDGGFFDLLKHEFSELEQRRLRMKSQA